MSLPFYTQPDEAAKVLFDYLIDNPDDIDQDLRKRMLDMLSPGKSISFAVSEAAELIFARKSELPKGAVRIGAIMATTASYHNINNFADDDGKRGRGIASALRRHYGEKAPVGASWPSKEEDPEPKQIFLPPTDSDADVVPAPEPSAPAE